MSEQNEAMHVSRLDALRQAYLERLPDKLRDIALNWERMCSSEDFESGLDDLIRSLHTLAGSAATFGCNAVSDIARRFEGLLKQAAGVDWQGGELFLRQGDAYLSWLADAAYVEGGARQRPGRMAEREFSPPADGLDIGEIAVFPQPSQGRDLVYLLQSGDESAKFLEGILKDWGFAVETFTDAVALDNALSRCLPAIVIFDTEATREGAAGADIAACLARRAGGDGVSLVFLSSRDDFAARLAAVRANACAYLTKPVAVDELARSLGAMCSRSVEETYRISVVDDDELSLLAHCKALASRGMQTQALSEPLTALATLDQFKPELILMDLHMPGCSGLELAAVLRQLSRYDDVPIVFLSADSDIDQRLAAFNLGGDDFLTKPIAPGRLAEAVRQRVRRARALRFSNKRSRDAIQAAHQTLWALDQHAVVSMSDRAGKIIYVNQKFCQISGYSREELLGQNHRIVKGGMDPEIYKTLWSSISRGHIWQGILRNRRKDGGFYWVETTIVPVVDGAGRFSRYISIRTDITHLREVQEQLILAKEMAERASQAKSEFLSRMSHELRTPLNAILGFSQLLQADPDEPLSLEQKDNVEQIMSAGWHLLELINEILDLSKIEAGKFRVNLEPVTLDYVLHNCRDLIAPLAEQRRVTVLEDISCCARTPVWADPIRIKQVMLNLLSNAIKYNREGGQVRITCEVSEAFVLVSIRDQGCGLSEEQMAHLFEPFNRFDAEFSGQEGTGIGLVITLGLLNAMGGELRVASKEGEGSVFTAVLPRVAEGQNEEDGLFPAGSAHEPQPMADEAMGFDVLCIEDNPANAKVLSGLLARRPAVKLYTATAGADGIALARIVQPKIILLDIQMPDMDGYEVLRRLRALPETADSIVMALSANAMPEDIEKGLVAGFYRYITKPIKFDHFLAALDEAMERVNKRGG